MAVADAAKRKIFYAEVDKQTGYSTQTILATPLNHNGEIICVWNTSTASANRPLKPLRPKKWTPPPSMPKPSLRWSARMKHRKVLRIWAIKFFRLINISSFRKCADWLKNLRNGDEHREMLDLAILIREIARRGNAEREMCREILESVLRYSDNRNETSFLSL